MKDAAGEGRDAFIIILMHFLVAVKTQNKATAEALYPPRIESKERGCRYACLSLTFPLPHPFGAPLPGVPAPVGTCSRRSAAAPPRGLARGKGVVNC